MNSQTFTNIDRLDVPEAFRAAIVNIRAIRESTPEYDKELGIVERNLRHKLMDKMGWKSI